MFGYCVWLEIPSLQPYVNYYSLMNFGEHFIPHVSIATRCTLEEALKLCEEIPNVAYSYFTIGNVYQTETDNFHAIQCDILECPDHHISIAYRYNIPWTDLELQACRPPTRGKTGSLSVWNCNGLVSGWVKKHSVPTPQSKKDT